ncbi:MAG: hypothetical protein ACRD2E_04305 [Terriglobales bacterium]
MGAPVRNAYAYVANQPLEATDPLGLVDPPDPSALYAESGFDVWQATGGFGANWGEFNLLNIPVVGVGAQADTVWYDYEQTISIDGTVNEIGDWLWTTDPL